VIAIAHTDMLNMNNQCCNWYTTKNTWT